jgi:hypothetical protein
MERRRPPSVQIWTPRNSIGRIERNFNDYVKGLLRGRALEAVARGSKDCSEG